MNLVQALQDIKLNNARLALAALCVGAMFAAASVVLAPEPRNWAGAPLGLVVAWLAAIDLERRRLPDVIVLPLVVLGLAYNAFFDPAFLSHAVIGAVGGYLFFYAISTYYRFRTGRDGLGLGDAKLLAAQGAWLGWVAIPTILLLGASLGLLQAFLQFRGKAQRSSTIAFGPALIVAFWGVWLFGPLTPMSQ